MQIWHRNTETERSNMNHIVDMIIIVMFTIENLSISRDDWTWFKFQGISVLPEYAPLRKFVVPRHHVMIGCDKLYGHIQRVQASFAHAEYSG